MATLETPVLIVVGGGSGLTASMLLSKLGIESKLVSALSTTSIPPKAHVLNQRAIEILTDTGVADEIYRRSKPAANMSHTAYYRASRVPIRSTAGRSDASSVGAPAASTGTGRRRARAGRRTSRRSTSSPS